MSPAGRLANMDATIPLENCPALILNADYRPLCYSPLSVWSWQDAVRAIIRKSAIVLSEYNRTVRSPSVEMRLPSVLVLKTYIPVAETPAFTRFNVFLRDRWCCQYCGGKFRTQELTFDHVIPRSRGGRTNWSNIVAACHSCNLRKGDKTPEEVGLKLLARPEIPSVRALQSSGRKFPRRFLHESWGDFLYWDTELVDPEESSNK